MKGKKKAFFQSDLSFQVIAHRGSSREFPENTIESFARALEINQNSILEMDVWPSRDGEVLVMHDGLLECITEGTGPVYKKTLSEIRELEAGYNISFDNGATWPFRGKGYRVALLRDVLERFKDARMSIDIKYDDPGFASKVVKLIEECGAVDQVILGSFFNRIIPRVRKLNPSIATSFTKREIILFILFQRFGLAGIAPFKGDALMVPEYSDGEQPEELGDDVKQGLRIVTPAFIKSAHKRGVPVYVWTVNRRENMERLIQWGVDGIVSDIPSVLLEVINQ